jgi:hypothetical protein
MKFISATLLILLIFGRGHGQSSIPEKFLEGKSVVLISSAPQARPVMNWAQLAQEIHQALLDAGGDPVAYYELEEITISEEVQAGYAAAFTKRLISNIIILTRTAQGGVALHVSNFNGSKSLINAAGNWGLQASSLDMLKENLVSLGKNVKTKNLLVLDVPEFPSKEPAQGMASTNIGGRFLNRNPLNLDVFKLGVPLSGAAGETVALNAYRYDMLGKSATTIEAEQAEEKRGMERIFQSLYPHQVEYLTIPKSDAELIRDRVQFVLMRVEAREADLMQSMGIPVDDPDEKTDIVVKYYIKFLVRNELYIGPVWDAHPNWETSLTQFLNNLKIK